MSNIVQMYEATLEVDVSKLSAVGAVRLVQLLLPLIRDRRGAADHELADVLENIRDCALNFAATDDENRWRPDRTAQQVEDDLNRDLEGRL